MITIKENQALAFLWPLVFLRAGPWPSSGPWSSSEPGPGLPQLVLELQVSDGGQVDLVRPVGDAQRPGVHIPADVTHVTPCTIADYGEFRSTLQCFSLVK